MKRIKRLFCLLVLLILVSVQLVPILNVWAVDTEGVKIQTSDDSNLIVNTSTITITNLPNDEETFAAYKILDAFYNANTNEITYDFTNDFSTFLKQDNLYKNFTVNDYLSMKNKNSYSTLENISGNYAIYIRNNNIAGLDMVTNGKGAYLDGATVGSYLVLPRSNKYVYNVMVGNIELYTEGNAWKIKNALIAAKYDDLVLESYITNKAVTSVEEYLNVKEHLVVDKSFLIGQEYTNVIVTDVDYPDNAINKLYKMEIILDDGITFSGIETLVVINSGMNKIATVNSGRLYLDGVDVGSVVVDNKSMVVEVELNKWSSSSVALAFKTKLNDNAIIGGNGNMMTTKLSYASDPFNRNSIVDVESVNTSYTYGLNIGNYGDETKSLKLNGSVFEIYSDNNLSNKIGEVNITDGDGSFVGISMGKYYLKQKTAAAGYKLLKDVVEVQINDEADYTSVYIVNAEAGFLPSTGGVGTVIYTLIGLAIISVSLFGFVYYRKKTSI